MQILHHQIQILHYIFFLTASNMLMQVANLQKGFGLLTFLILLEPCRPPSAEQRNLLFGEAAATENVVLELLIWDLSFK